MKISAQAKTLLEAVSVVAQDVGGKAQVVANTSDMWLSAAKQSQTARVLICYVSEAIRGDFGVAAALHRVDRLWNVAVTRGRGFAVQRGKTLTDPVQNAEPFYDFVEKIRDTCRAQLAISEELPVDYLGIRTMENGELIIDGFIIEFSTANDIPAITATPPDAQIEL